MTEQPAAGPGATPAGPAGGAVDGASPDAANQPAGAGEGSAAAAAGKPEGQGDKAHGEKQGDEKKTGGEAEKADPAGDAASKATSRAGVGSVRGESLSDAEWAIHGDVAGQKNVFFLGGAHRLPPQRLSADLEDPATAAFAQPQGWEELSAGFFSHRTVIVRGPRGCGKTTAVIRLLLRSGSVFHLDDAIDLNQLAESVRADGGPDGGIERDARFLLVRPEKFGHLRAASLQRIDEALERADARLALIIDDHTPLPDPDLLAYTLTLSAPPRHGEVFDNHVRWRLGESLGELVLEREDVRWVAQRLLPRADSCSLAARLAEWVAREYETHGRIDAERIAARMSRWGTEEFDIWFASLEDAQTRCFAVALAVLGGLAHERVSAAARGLHERLGRPRSLVISSPADGPYDGAGPFRTDRSERLRRLMAAVRQIEVRGDYGRSVTETIAYRDPHLRPQAVLRHVWSQYQIQPELLDWLASLAADGALPVRIRAGLALGRIAAESFDYVCERVLEPWAYGNREERWDAVAYALREVAYSVPELVPAIRRLTGRWYANTSSRSAQATAARVHGVCLGRLDPKPAVDALHRLLASAQDEFDNGRISVGWAIGDSLTDLLWNSDFELAEYALSALERAMADRRRTHSAQLAFLILANSLHARMSDAAHRDDWPYLLAAAREHKELRDPLASVWRRVVKESRFHEQAQDVMTGWARSAEADEELRDVFLRLLRSMARGDRRCALILDTYARAWTSADGITPLPAVASALRTIIAADRELTS
ncbi:ATP-binding protein [Actinocrinis puniceicyclus]|uniref:ATP-binding protein n=1 Tax=Actinocrinis puniceicyclus TaxID=977794 RepID=A0A8J7WN11_9ACTN|nr:ATP-binding protein [Actinocrinis puniceicyclus]MBS2965368.1 ATP-binding protein [Actinocrinis puniceicyclus]